MKIKVKELLECYDGESSAISDEAGDGWKIKSIKLNKDTLDIKFDVKKPVKTVKKLTADVLAELIARGFNKKMSGDWFFMHPKELLDLVALRYGVSRRRAYELLVEHKWRKS